MQGWSLKTKQQKSQTKQDIKYKVIFRYLMPPQFLYHLQSTKNLLISKLLTTNAIQFHTLPDYYLNSEVANRAVQKCIGRVLEKVWRKQYDTIDGDMEVMKNALCFAQRGKVMEQLPWFLK